MNVTKLVSFNLKDNNVILKIKLNTQTQESNLDLIEKYSIMAPILCRPIKWANQNILIVMTDFIRHFLKREILKFTD